MTTVRVGNGTRKQNALYERHRFWMEIPACSADAQEHERKHSEAFFQAVRLHDLFKIEVRSTCRRTFGDQDAQ